MSAGTVSLVLFRGAGVVWDFFVVVNFYWNTVDLQYYVSFCCMVKWISFIHTHTHTHTHSFKTLFSI